LVRSEIGKINAHPFYELKNYVPFLQSELCLYDSLREAVPIIDAAICKLVRLVGWFEVECKNQTTQKQLNKFLAGVNVNGAQNGANAFVYSYFEQMLTYGTGLGEILLSGDNKEIAALYNAGLKNIKLKHGKNPTEIKIFKATADKDVEFKNQSLLLCTLLNPKPGTLKGTSVLKGLPFVSSILLMVLNSIGTNWERVGNVRFAVNYKPSADSLSGGLAQEQAQTIASEWGKAMKDTTQVRDFVSVGDVSVKVIGAENQMPDCDIPIHRLSEQIVSKLSIPPFLLGLSWSSTERMSSQQADILTSELEHYRQLLNPVIKKICDLWLRLHGGFEDYEIKWNHVNLQDEITLANARLVNAQAAII
jgi:hypothetical protein